MKNATPTLSIRLLAFASLGAGPVWAQNTTWPMPVPPPVNPTFTQCLNTHTASITCVNDSDCNDVITKEFTGTGNTMGEAIQDWENKAKCPEGYSRTGSVIDNFTFNHMHTATDYAPAVDTKAGCSSCGGGIREPEQQTFARLSLMRIHSPRDMTQVSSLGPGVFMGYDVTMTLFDVNGTPYIDINNPAWKGGARRYAPSGTVFLDRIYDSVKSVVLLDAAGLPTATRTAAVRAVYTSRNGETQEYELFELDGNRKGGRLLRTKSAAGLPVMTFTYGVAANDSAATADSKWLKSSASDLSGDTVSFRYSTLANGRTVLVAADLPGSRTVAYAYDAGANLTGVTYPGGDTSTFTRTATPATLDIVYAEAGAEGSHRNKTAHYSNNIASSMLNLADRPPIYNQSSMLATSIVNGAGEYSWWGVTSGASSMIRKVYEGGGRMKIFNVASVETYLNWSLDAAGWSATNPVSSITGVLEKNKHTSAYQSYAQARMGRYPNMTLPDGRYSTFKYDANGNPVLNTTGTQVFRAAYDARFNKVNMNVEPTGDSESMAYDDAGNLTQRRRGQVFDSAVSAGTELRGLVARYYQGVTSLEALATATPVSVMQSPSVMLGLNPTASTNWGMRYEGKLVLTQDGERTFNLAADDRAVLSIDGVVVTDVTWRDGKKSAVVNLTAGAHDIRVDFFQANGGLNLDLTWSGPETTDAAGNAATTMIAQNYLVHDSVAGEVAVHDTAATAVENWDYYPVDGEHPGMLRAHVDPTGRRTEYAYDSAHRLVQIRQTGDDGALATVETRAYDAVGNLASRTDALGRTVAFTYDARNRLVKTVYGDGTTEVLTYGTGADANLVVARKDRAGSVTKTEYDAVGRPATVTRGYALADHEGNITQTLPGASVESFTYVIGTSDILTRTLDGKLTEYVYDHKGRRITETSHPSSGKTLVTRTAYSGDEQPYMRTDAHGCRTFYAYRTPDRRLVREIRELVPGVLGENFPIAPVMPILLAPGCFGPNAVSSSTDAGILAKPRDASPNPGYVITDYTLDDEGRTIGVTDGRGVRTTTAYDVLGRVASRTEAYATPSARTTAMTYDAADRLLTETDALNRITSREYFPSGRMKKVVLPDAKTREFTYFADGKLDTAKDEDGFISKRYWSPCCGRDAGNADPLGQGQVRFTDGEGRVTYVATVKNVEAARAFGPNLPADAVVAAQTMKYDARGRLAATTRWLVVPASVDPKNPPVATDPTQGLTTTYAYFDDLTDARFAPILAKLTEQGKTLTAGSATVVTNPAGEQSFTVADGAGRPITSGVFNK